MAAEHHQVLEPPPQPHAASEPPPRRRQRRCIVHDHHGQLVPYHTGWQWQRDIVSSMTASAAHPQQSPPPPQQQQGVSGDADQVIILQHPPIYTLGAGSTEDNILFQQGVQAAVAAAGTGGGVQGPGGAPPDIPVVRTERGGEVTYHGPGQLVLYPLLDLAQHTKDLHWYMRQLEEVVIRALWEVSGIEGRRVEGLTGVWVGDEKVAAIGVRAKRWVTFHGLALNVCPDLAPFDGIVPCGIKDRGVTSVQRLLALPCGAHPLQQHHGTTVAQDGAAEAQRLQREELLDEYSFALLDAFAEVFALDLVRTPLS